MYSMCCTAVRRDRLFQSTGCESNEVQYNIGQSALWVLEPDCCFVFTTHVSVHDVNGNITLLDFTSGTCHLQTLPWMTQLYVHHLHESLHATWGHDQLASLLTKWQTFEQPSLTLKRKQSEVIKQTVITMAVAFYQYQGDVFNLDLSPNVQRAILSWHPHHFQYSKNQYTSSARDMAAYSRNYL